LIRNERDVDGVGDGTKQPTPVSLRVHGSCLVGAMHDLYGTRATTGAAKILRHEMTAAETLLWRSLRQRQLGAQFRRQHATARFVLDFFAPSRRVAVELDGPVHAQRAGADAERDAWLAALGVRTLRFTNDDVVDNLPAVLDAIRAALEPGTAPSEGGGS